MAELELKPRGRDILTPYYHPTTVCFVDDNESFMTGLSLVTPEHMSSVAFFDPADALDFVNRPLDMPSIADRCVSAHAVEPTSLFRVNTGLIEEEISVLNRFGRLSVAVVDYSMPIFNGLEFCERIIDPHVGKILLTGVADEKMAVEAFNAGIIDRFISKSHPEATNHISEYLLDMQRAYFRSQSQQLVRTLSIAGPLFLNDPIIANWVHRLMRRRNFCEYYMVSEPSGLILLTPDGQISQLIVLSEADCNAQADYALAHAAPDAVVRKLRNRSHVGFFLEDAGGYDYADLTGSEESAQYPWHDLLHRATRLGDRGQYWYVALVAQPPHNIDYTPAAACHDTWAARRNSQRPPRASIL